MKWYQKKPFKKKLRIAKTPRGFKPDEPKLDPVVEDMEHDGWGMWITPYLIKAEYIAVVRLEKDGRLSGDISEPGADVWFLLRVVSKFGNSGLMIFNRTVFYPIKTRGNFEKYIAESFNSANMRATLFTEKDREFLTLFVDAVCEKVWRP
jgi:hypothetical protein